MPFQVTTTSPLRSDAAPPINISGPSWESSTVRATAMIIYNPATGASRLIKPVNDAFAISAKVRHALSRPRGMSLSQWRKLRRERRNRR